MILTRADFEKVDLERLRPFVSGPNANEFFMKTEHYRLLATLSTFVAPGKKIIDIGTCYGDSALALSYNGNYVDSFDVTDMVGGRSLPDTINRNQANLFDSTVRESYREALLSSGLILIDIAPHAGTQELELVQWLQQNGYAGLIVLDDIWWYKEMRDNLWYRIEPQFRTDATSFGHWSGSGIVSFSGRVEIEGEPDTSNWTLVTSYFNLPARHDASEALKARQPEWYIDQHGPSVLCLDQNLVVFCDPEFEARLWAARPKWLHARTRIIPMTLEEFPLSKYRDRIIENRSGALWCPSDPRATATYYLFCMARYAMAKRVMVDNPFESTRFGWIDMGIERMGYKNLVHLNDALGAQRDRFSVCWIDYQSRPLVEDLHAYFGGGGCYGRCSMSSGFFTGDAKHLTEFCNEIEAEFMICLEAGYGHADEQLYPRIFFRKPDLFHWYPGDYTEIITNYSMMREQAGAPIRNLIRNSFSAGDHVVCKQACDALLDSKECFLSDGERGYLEQTRNACL